MEHAVKKLFKLLMVIQIFKIAIFEHVYVGSFTEKTLLYPAFDGKEIATNTKCIIKYNCCLCNLKYFGYTLLINNLQYL